MTRQELGMVWTITARELRDQLRDWRIIAPMVILTLFFPYLMNWTARQAINFVGQYGSTLLAERLVPFLIMVVGFFPLTVSLVVALEAFVGEKERGTIEPMLSSPLKDWQLYMGKLLASIIVPLFTSYLGIGVYLGSLALGGVPLPSLNIILQTLALTAAQGILMVSGAIVISAQSTTVRAANLLASFIIIPVALLVQGESVLMFWGTENVLWLAVFGVSVMAVLLVRLGLAHFQREHLLSREIDTLNLKWMARLFWTAFTGRQTSLWGWLTREIPSTLYRMRVSIALTLLLGFVSVAAAYYGVQSFIDTAALRTDSISFDEIRQAVSQMDNGLLSGEISFGGILGNNIRASVVAFLLGSISFSVVGMLAFIANMGLIGGVFGALGSFGLPQWTLFVNGILPHGILELPAIALLSAAVLHMGVVLVTPNARKTFTDVLIETFADWLKLFLALALPALIIAAWIETNITPTLLLQALGQILQ
ncbi:MAG: stage II sporulation protein M [Anaerolineales bacterium]